MVLNRVTTVAAPGLSASDARAAVANSSGITADVLRVHADLTELRARQLEVAGRFLTAYPAVPVATVPAQPADVHDLDGLRAIGDTFA
jgi:hypothetical protein